MPVVSLIELPALTVRQGSVLARLWSAVTVVAPKMGGWLHDLLDTFRQPVLYLGAGSSICYAAWQVAQPLGWFLIGLTLLLVEGMTSKPTEGHE